MKTTRLLLPALFGLWLLAGCEPDVPTTPETVPDRLRGASTDPVYYERADGDTTTGWNGSVQSPADVPADPVSRAGWFLGEYGEAFGVADPAEELTMREVIEGEAGTTEEGDALVVFDRTEDGIPVYGAGVRVEVASDGSITAVVSQTPGSVSISTTPSITREVAITSAMAAEPGTRLVDATLVILNEAMLRGETGPSVLTWFVRLDGSGLRAPQRFVDAQTGRLLPFQTTGRIDARNRSTSTAGLTCDPTTSTLVLTERAAVAGTTPTADAQTAHDMAGTVWSYYWNTFRRDSHDGRGAAMITTTDIRDTSQVTVTCMTDMDCALSCGTATCDTSTGRCTGFTTTPGACPATEFCGSSLMACEPCVALGNAYWSSGSMSFGEGMVTLDIFGHEYTHGVVEASAGLVYASEAGALNESFADVFGWFIDNDDTDIGEGSALGVLRSLQDPTLHWQPSHTMNQMTLMAGQQPDRTNDWGGVHTNSGIPNLAAYLTSEGGTHPISGVMVNGIGKTKTEQIWFRALTWYMTSGSTFMGAKIALRLAAYKFVKKSLHGVTYEDCGSVLNAYGAVGVGSPDMDNDCFTDAVDNCPSVYNPEQTDESCRCARYSTCSDCTLNDGCAWCPGDGADGGAAGTCMRQAEADMCMGGETITEYAMCEPSCSDDGAPCGGSGASFDDQCCESFICVVGACRSNEGGRERASCDPTTVGTCALGLDCRPVSSDTAAPTCCAEAEAYCDAKADCCGLMDCVSNRCVGRNVGEACILGDCIGTAFCSGGTCR